MTPLWHDIAGEYDISPRCPPDCVFGAEYTEGDPHCEACPFAPPVPEEDNG